MSVFKPFLTSDVTLSPFEVNKSFTFSGSTSLYENGIDRFRAYNVSNPNETITGSGTPAFPITGKINQYSSYYIYKSISHLYYSNFYDEQTLGSPANRPIYNTDGTITGEQNTTNNYNYPQTTLSQNRFLTTSSISESLAYTDIISIPSSLYGEYIKPGSIKIIEGNSGATFTDNGEGILYRNGQKVGNVIYQHGMLIFDIFKLTNISQSIYISDSITCSFSSSITLYESQYKCTIRENEFNFSQNPTLISGSTNSGIAYDFTTGSYFNPYITTVGLYNNNKELIAVAKLAQPLPTSPTTDTNILINLDI